MRKTIATLCKKKTGSFYILVLFIFQLSLLFFFYTQRSFQAQMNACFALQKYYEIQIKAYMAVCHEARLLKVKEGETCPLGRVNGERYYGYKRYHFQKEDGYFVRNADYLTANTYVRWPGNK